MCWLLVRSKVLCALCPRRSKDELRGGASCDVMRESSAVRADLEAQDAEIIPNRPHWNRNPWVARVMYPLVGWAGCKSGMPALIELL